MLTHSQVCRRAYSVLALFAIIALLTCSFVTTAFSQTPNRITSAIDESNLVPTSSRNVHPFATAQNDMGRVSDSLPMEKIILLLMRSPEQKAALDAMVDELHNPRSPMFHKWLTPDEIGRTYGPSDHDLGVITAWLQSHGFAIDEVPAGRTHIIISGTAGQIRQTFHTEIHNYLVNGQTHVANNSEPQIPAALSQVIQGFRSLHNFLPHAMVRNSRAFKKDAKTGKWYPTTQGDPQGVDITYGSGSTADYLVGPQDWYVIYNENPLLTASTPINGSGQTIAVIEETDINHTDVTTFRSQFNLPTYPASPNNTQGGVNYLQGASGTCTDPGILTDGEEPEADLDVQWAGVTAPAATIDFVSCATTSSTAGIDLAATYIVNHLSSSVSSMSLSYGVCETELTGTGANGIYQADSYYNKLWEQAAAQGQTAIVSSGDSGSEGCNQNLTVSTSRADTNGTQISGMESTPYNVSAGGTDFSDTFNGINSTYWNTTDSSSSPYESALSYVPETPWGSYCANPLFLQYAITNDGFPSTETIPQFCVALRSTSTAYDDVVGGSGGASNCATGTPATAGLVGGSCAGYAKPSWQSAYGVPADGVRDVPDLSFFASSGFWQHFLVYCDSATDPCNYSSSTDGEALGAGGTSFVGPAINGIMALVAQKTGSWQGQADYTLYAMAANEYGAAGSSGNSSNLTSCNANEGNAIGSSCVFYDIGPTFDNATNANVASAITQPCNTISGTTTQTPCYKGSSTIGVSSTSNTTEVNAWSATAGYDYATGIGSANVTNLVNNWNSYGASFATTTSLSANPTTLTSSTQSTTLTSSVATTGRGGISAASGSVQFYIGSTTGTPLGSAPLTSSCTGSAPSVVCTGTAQLSVQATQLQSGNNSIIAYFPGDGANDAASTSSAVIVNYQSQVSSTTAVSSSLNPSAYGQSVSFTATVTGNSPTGTVQFNIDGSAFGSPVTLSGGSATSGSTNTLAVGTHTVTAVYSGDSNNLGSTGTLSGGQVVQTAGAGTITVGSSQNPSTYGQSVTFTATIPGQYGQVRNNGKVRSQIVTGTVAWSSNTGCGTTNVTSGTPGTATCTTSALPTGSDTVTANYSGDANHSAGSGSTSQTVNQVTSSTAVSSSLNPSTYGQSVSFTATVTGSSPTGTVQFNIDGSAFGSPVTLSSGTASSGSINSLAVGTHTVTAVYSGDTNNAGSTGTLSGGQVVQTAGAGTITVGSSQNPSTYGTSVTFTATIPGQYNFIRKNGRARSQDVTGTVTWSDNTGCGTTDVTSGNPGTATCTTSSLPVGSDSVVANYSGDANHNPGSGSTSQTVNQVTSSTSVSSSLDPSTYGQAVSFTATVTGSSPTGTVQFNIDGSAFGSPVTLSSGTASSGSVSTLAVGTHTVTAVYSGDTNNAGSTGTLSGGQVVQTASAGISVSSSQNPSNYGQSVTFTATISGEYGLVKRNGRVRSQDVTGTVTWSDNTGCGTTNVTSGNPGTATCTTTSLPVGTDTITATYSGDANHSGGSGSLSGGQVVNQVSSSVSVSSSLDPSTYGQSVSFTATVTGNSPTGTVQFNIDGSAFGSPVTLSSGSATSGSISTLAVGTHTVTATYSGDGNNAGGTGTLSGGQVVQTATAGISVSSSQNPSNYGQSVTFTATISGEYGLVKKNGRARSQDVTGTVTWSDNTGCGTTNVTSGNPGTATCTTTSLPVGTDTITATYSGDANHSGGSGSLSGGQIVNQGNSSTAVSSSLDPSTYGQSVSFSATVTGSSPTGTVQFNIDGSAFGSPVTLSSGTASSGSINTLAVGTHTVTAVYSGDSNNSTSTGLLSGGQVVQTASAGVSVSSSQNPTTYNQSVTFTATINGEYGLVRKNGRAHSQDVTGTVAWSSNTGCGTTNVTSGNPGTATCTTTALNAGGDTVTATYSGDANHSGSSGSVNQTVNPATATVTLSSLTQTYNGSALSPTVTTTPTGLSYSLTGAPDTNAGSYPVTATITNPNYTGSASGTFVISKASQKITFTTPPPSSAGYESQFTVVATASSGLQVLFNASGVCTYSNTATDTATYTITSPSGICIVIANQPGNSNWTAAPEQTPQLNATKGTPVITWNPAAISYGTKLGSGQLDATAANGVGGTVAGTFTYSPKSGTILDAGTQTLSATFKPTSTTDYNSTSATASLQVSQATTTTTVTSNDQTVTLKMGTATATIDYLVSSYKPTGTVTVTATTGETCSSAVSSTTGKGSCKLTFATTGTRNVDASYPGDANHTSSNSDSQNPQITVTVNQ